MEEIWKPVLGHEGRYSVSNLGRVRSHLRCRGISGKILKPYAVRHGYLKVDLIGKERFTAYIARLVMLAFVGEDPSRPHVNHKNGDKIDNRLENLEWCTRSENLLHSYRVLGKGKYRPNLRGVLNHNAKLTDERVMELRQMAMSGDSIRKLSRISGMNRTSIAAMIHGRTWKHVHHTQAAPATDH